MKRQTKGMALAAFGGSLWGLAGIMVELLFKHKAFSPEWVVSNRLVYAGVLILAYAKLIMGQKICRVFKQKKDASSLLAFALIGMAGVQYLFFKAIESSGAALAAILQFTAPIFIYLYQLLAREKALYWKEFLLILGAVFGVGLMVTNGSLNSLNFSSTGVFAGIGSAVAGAFYILQPRRIQAIYGSATVVGWGMLLAGIFFQGIAPIWSVKEILDLYSLILLAGIIVFGTAFSFLSYLSSTAYISPSLASVMTALEPILSVILTVLIFKKSFGLYEIIGMVLVLSMVIFLSQMESKGEN
ncbi:EamA family transporter [Atopobacter sp. AH10]|uniref:DMT family transporter n=1 Tax=Atopobacter sp. AH10 TaxID=2315861 RepID=UPI000EF26532|nr:DMT family transporter [Atopobacter sp. AH10]RLK63498.1 EamA family transporter [Atopobacter sp. AH10]